MKPPLGWEVLTNLHIPGHASSSWLNGDPLKRYVQVLNPVTHECGLYFVKQDLCRCNQDKIRSYWTRVGPKSSDWCPYKKRRGHTKRHRGKMATCRWRERLEGCIYRSRNGEDGQEPPEAGRGKGGLSFCASRGVQPWRYLECTLLTSRTEGVKV